VKDMQKEQILIEFNEEINPLEEKEEEKTDNQAELEGVGDGMPVLDQKTLHSIASNVASKLDQKISTENYEKQVMKEVGIATLESPGRALEEQAQQARDENAIAQAMSETSSTEDYDVPNMIRKDNTTVSYFLEGRWHNYIYIPTYKCQGGGTVIIDIVINQSGEVLSAIISDNKSTSDPCLREEAYNSAISARFNVDPNASTKQLGTITYVFISQ
jgi:hypothetical protein